MVYYQFNQLWCGRSGIVITTTAQIHSLQLGSVKIGFSAVQWRIQGFFGQTGTNIESTMALPWLLPDILKMHSLTLPFSDFFVKHFPNYLSLHYEKRFRE